MVLTQLYEGQFALATGAGAGIGAATARLLAEGGARLVHRPNRWMPSLQRSTAGVIDTPILNFDGDHVDDFAQSIPLKRRGQPEEVAAINCILLSDEASYVTGAHIAVDGGWFA